MKEESFYDAIKDLIKYFEDRITELEEEQETSHFPEGEEEQLNRCEECKDSNFV